MLDWLLLLTVAGAVLFATAFRAADIGPRARQRRRFAHIEATDLAARYLFVKGRRRSYHLYVPPNLPDGRTIPLVLAFHGGGGHGLRFRQVTGFDALADRFGFALAYPNAIRYWNDGRPGTRSGPDDVAFVRKLIKYLVKHHRIDPKRVYATGQSNGGLLTIRLACELSDRIAAFAPVLASMPVEYRPHCRPRRPLPILFINATADPLVPWKGGDIPAGTSLGTGGRVISVPDTIRFWRAHNGCEEAPSRQGIKDTNGGKGIGAEFLRFKNCRQGSDLAVVKIRGGGHVWPGARVRPTWQPERPGDSGIGLDASQVVWKFFEDRALP